MDAVAGPRHARSASAELAVSPPGGVRERKRSSLFSRLSFRIRSRSNSIEDKAAGTAPSRKVSLPASMFGQLSHSAPPATGRRGGTTALRRAKTFAAQQQGPPPAHASEYADMNAVYQGQQRLLRPLAGADYVEMGQNSLPRSRKPNRKPRAVAPPRSEGERARAESEGSMPAWLRTDMERRMQKAKEAEKNVVGSSCESLSASSSGTDTSKGSNVVNIHRPRSAKDYARVNRKAITALDGGGATYHSDDELTVPSDAAQQQQCTKYPQFCTLPRRQSAPCKISSRSIAYVNPQSRTEDTDAYLDMRVGPAHDPSPRVAGPSLAASHPRCAVVNPMLRQVEDLYLVMDGRTMKEKTADVEEDGYLMMEGAAATRSRPHDSAPYVKMSGGAARTQQPLPPSSTTTTTTASDTDYLMMRPVARSGSPCQPTPAVCHECGCHRVAPPAAAAAAAGGSVNYMELKASDTGGSGGGGGSSPRRPATEYVSINLLATQAMKCIGDERERQRREGSPYSANP
ncbi:PREDICTED: uncharacterized protein LOC106818226 [Priapulus caudatus]|uniref:Uncharacterized protein LOC106818226 n=1 Tax=Priapulus caudatus TaxID=37621 RepID=A0ABM1F1W5_PRICU|nr:PREDICTED: uncharacterized protein LOC106818226 [Priapulus caudatus]